MEKEPTKFYVYAAINLINSKVYIGKTKNSIETRWKKHLNTAKVGPEKDPQHFQYLHASIAKHGKENFEVIQLEVFDNEKDCFAAEMFWIKFLMTMNREFGFNRTAGGEGSSGRIVSAETCDKISNSRKNKCVGEDNYFYGKTHSEETKAKIGASSKGRNVGENSFWYGKTKSEEIRKNISNGKIGKYTGENASFYGKQHTDASKQKISAAKRARRKFSREDILKIREMIIDKISNKEIAKMYSVDSSTISHIKRRKIYSDIE